MSPPIEERLAVLHEHYIRQINASVATGRWGLVRELADEYEDESLQLMLSHRDGTPGQPSRGPADILELGGWTTHGRSTPRADTWRSRFWRRHS